MRRALVAVAGALLLCACGDDSEGPDRGAASPPRAEDVARAVERGLAWFERVQEEDGSFSLSRWNPHHGHPDLEGFSKEDLWFDVAATGLVVLAFADAGHASVADPGDSCVQRALRWLLTRQLDDGRFGYYEDRVDHDFVTKMHKRSLFHPEGAGYKARTIHMFNHAVATAAVAAAHRISRDRALRPPLRRAIRNLEHDEHPEYVWTSYYDPNSDVAVVPYVLLAARAAATTGLARDAQPLLEPALDFLDRVTDETTGRTVMLGDPPHCFDGHDSTAINAFCRRLLGQDPATGTLSLALASIAEAPMAWEAADDLSDHERALGAVVNHELWFHGSLAFAGVDADPARRFRDRVAALLVANQQRTGDHAGSWDPIGVWDRVGGRIYATAMAVRSLAGGTSPALR